VFGADVWTKGLSMNELEFDAERVDETILALMYLGLHTADRLSDLSRSWKSYDWEALKRLHVKELIFDPVNNSKSVILTDEGRERCETLFWELFAKRG
jgi:hypothetical protein